MAMERVQTTALDIPWTRAASAPVLRIRRARRPRVLVVEDDNDLRALIAADLQRDGLDVIACADAREAARQKAWVRAMSGSPWSLDVVVTDLCLGAIDGLALLQRIAEANADVPVVLISGFGDASSRARAAALGVAAFLDKPVEIPALARLVWQLVSERQERLHAGGHTEPRWFGSWPFQP